MTTLSLKKKKKDPVACFLFGDLSLGFLDIFTEAHWEDCCFSPDWTNLTKQAKFPAKLKAPVMMPTLLLCCLNMFYPSWSNKRLEFLSYFRAR